MLPEAVMLVFTSNPLSGAIDAVTLPLAILDKFNPVITDAGILVNPDPSPLNPPPALIPPEAVILVTVAIEPDFSISNTDVLSVPPTKNLTPPISLLYWSQISLH